MKFDNTFAYTGEYGRYHKLVSLSVCSMIIPIALFNICTVFINGSMDHHCKLAETANCSDVEGDDCWNANISMSLPPDDQKTLLINETQCRMYTTNDNETELTNCEYGWKYDRSHYDSTIVSEFNLVCEDSYKTSLAASLYLAGFLVGSLVFGLMCDYFGRKVTIFVAFAILQLTGALSGLAKSYWLYALTRFLNGTANVGLFLAIFTYVTEFVGPSRRAMMAGITNMYWCLGYMLTAVIAYFIRSFRTLLIVFSISVSPLLLLCFFIPESARWLLVKKKTDEAKHVLQRIAKGNNVGLPEDLFTNLEIDTTPSEVQTRNTSPFDIFRYTSMRKKTLNISYSWFSIVLVYYGLTYGVEGLNVNVYIGTFLGGLTEAFAYLFTWFIIQKFGRRLMLGGTLMTGGIACFVNIWIPSSFVELRTATAMIGKFFITSAFSIVYIYTVELFPTDIRTFGLGFCSSVSRVAGVLAPQI
ncbi:organic cation transporter protein-like, partial [Anneissia japonica]|uniref:organic cation transporter protein-like n=1 Tax=Anneissia japonica TaxID=1529436 RepID=UPI00142561A2